VLTAISSTTALRTVAENTHRSAAALTVQ
jgi:hypothetical protein